jgi:hypothetical protein
MSKGDKPTIQPIQGPTAAAVGRKGPLTIRFFKAGEAVLSAVARNKLMSEPGGALQQLPPNLTGNVLAKLPYEKKHLLQDPINEKVNLGIDFSNIQPLTEGTDIISASNQLGLTLKQWDRRIASEATNLLRDCRDTTVQTGLVWLLATSLFKRRNSETPETKIALPKEVQTALDEALASIEKVSKPQEDYYGNKFPEISRLIASLKDNIIADQEKAQISLDPFSLNSFLDSLHDSSPLDIRRRATKTVFQKLLEGQEKPLIETAVSLLRSDSNNEAKINALRILQITYESLLDEKAKREIKKQVFYTFVAALDKNNETIINEAYYSLLLMEMENLVIPYFDLNIVGTVGEYYLWSKLWDGAVNNNGEYHDFLNELNLIDDQILTRIPSFINGKWFQTNLLKPNGEGMKTIDKPVAPGFDNEYPLQVVLDSKETMKGRTSLILVANEVVSSDPNERKTAEAIRENLESDPHISTIVNQENLLVVGCTGYAQKPENPRIIESDRPSGNAQMFIDGILMAIRKGFFGKGLLTIIETDTGKGTRFGSLTTIFDSTKGAVRLGKRPIRSIAAICAATMGSLYQNEGKGRVMWAGCDNSMFPYQEIFMAAEKLAKTKFGFYLHAQPRAFEFDKDVPATCKATEDASFEILSQLGQMALNNDGTLNSFKEKPTQPEYLREFLRRVALKNLGENLNLGTDFSSNLIKNILNKYSTDKKYRVKAEKLVEKKTKKGEETTFEKELEYAIIGGLDIGDFLKEVFDEINETNPRSDRNWRKLFFELANKDERTEPVDRQKALIKFAKTCKFTYVNTFFFNLSEETAKLFIEKYKQKSKSGKVLTDFEVWGQAFDLSKLILEAMIAKKENWEDKFDNMAKIAQKRNIKLVKEDWMLLWENAQEIKMQSAEEGEVNEADMESGKSSGIGVTVVDYFSDAGTLKEMVALHLRIFSQNPAFKKIARYFCGFHLESNFEANVQLGHVKLLKRRDKTNPNPYKEIDGQKYLYGEIEIIKSGSRFKIGEKEYDSIDAITSAFNITNHDYKEKYFTDKLTIKGDFELTQNSSGWWEFAGIRIKDPDLVYISDGSKVAVGSSIGERSILVNVQNSVPLDIPDFTIMNAARIDGPTEFYGPADIKHPRLLYNLEHSAENKTLLIPSQVCMGTVELYDGQKNIIAHPILHDIKKNSEDVLGYYPLPGDSVSHALVYGAVSPFTHLSGTEDPPIEGIVSRRNAKKPISVNLN